MYDCNYPSGSQLEARSTHTPSQWGQADSHDTEIQSGPPVLMQTEYPPLIICQAVKTSFSDFTEYNLYHHPSAPSIYL